jgi:predicted Zn-dependent protease
MSHNEREDISLMASEGMQQVETQESTSRSRLLETIALARAVLLARRGHLKQAEKVLLDLPPQSSSNTSVLDLLAKVYAQQNQMKEAQEIWLRAAQIEPSNIHFYRALIQCAKSVKR